MKIGLISDTHGYMDSSVFEHFNHVDEIWHAGDIGSHELADALEKFKPLKAVFGNIDDPAMQRRFPEDLWFNCGELSVLMTHIAGAPPNYNPRVRKLLKEKKPDVLVCGHSHILRVVRDPAFNIIYLNPGAAGNQGFHHMKTLLRFSVQGKELLNMEVVELGKRGVITKN